MSCPHWNADDYVAEGHCECCGFRGEVEFHTCSCISYSSGNCPICECEIRVEPQEVES